MNRLVILLLTITMVTGLAQTPPDPDAFAKKLMEAWERQDFDQVISLTESVAELGELERLRASALQRRGDQRFFQGDISGAIADFDAFLAIYPDQDPYHWQRGLAYYYAEQYDLGKAQFERHQTVNGQDVENAVWHFLCAVRAPGGSVEQARQDLIPIERDSRIPMREVHALFAGTGTVEAVLAAASPSANELSLEERDHLCYAHLYIGLYHEALGETEQCAHHIRLAAYDYAMDHYMGKIAQVHAKLRGIAAE
jgi:lipoprotein NlpI